MQHIKSFEIRWNDLDPNRHVANTTFSALMNERRMSFLAENGFTQESFQKLQIGPVILLEQFYYIKEVMPGSTVRIDVELLNNTPDYKYSTFCHSLFNEDGKMAVYSTCMFTWMDLKTRKTIVPPQQLFEMMSALTRSEQYMEISEEEIKSFNIPRRSLNVIHS